MSLKTSKRWQKKQWGISVLALLVALLLLPLAGNTKEKKSSNNTNRLPPAPDTGSPEEDFSAGGTRKRLEDTVCSEIEQNLIYLLGNRNREFTSSAYPTFWFRVPNTMNEITQMKFVVTELETGKKIYDRSIRDQKSGIIGITLPKEQKYALSPETNYAWSLEVDCSQTDEETQIALEGWLSRVSPSKLQDRLAAASKTERHQIYWQHNLLYDALTELARHRIAEPNNTQVEIAWNQLLVELGWQDLVQQQSAIEPTILDTRISSQKN